MTIKLPNFKRLYDYETFFHLTANKERYEKFLTHFEVFKKTAKLKGEIVECGVFKGTSFVRFCTFRDLFKLKKKVIGFDNFSNKYPLTKIKKDQQMIKNWIKKSGGKSISKNQLISTMKILKIKNYELIKGDVKETIPKYLKKNKLKISLLNIDIDFLESTKVCLENLYPLVEKNGIILLDNYGFGFGETKIINTFFKKFKKKNKLEKLHYVKNRPYFVVKK